MGYRTVTSTDPLWKRAGVGSTEVAAVMNCAAERDNRCLLCWARIVQKRDLQENADLKKVKLEQSSPEWLEWRTKGVGGSEVASVVGAAYSGKNEAINTWGRKLPPDHPNFVPEMKSNAAMELGKAREPLARKLYEDLFGWKAEDLCIVHDDYDFVRCSLDGIRADGLLSVEIKCSGLKNHYKYVDISKIEDPFDRQCAFDQQFRYYRYQVLYQLLITQSQVCHFVAYNPDCGEKSEQLAMFELYPEPEEQERLLERVKEFWYFVENREPPPAEWLKPCWKPPTDLAIPHTGHLPTPELPS